MLPAQGIDCQVVDTLIIEKFQGGVTFDPRDAAERTCGQANRGQKNVRSGGIIRGLLFCRQTIEPCLGSQAFARFGQIRQAGDA